jgi:hypothetical protein
MKNYARDPNKQTTGYNLTRRRFLGVTVAGGAAIIAGGSTILRAETATSTEGNSMFKIGGDLSVNRLGFGAMRITGDGIWGWPKDRDEARRVLKRASFSLRKRFILTRKEWSSRPRVE